MPVILEAVDGQQIHHKLLGADVQGLSGEPLVRQGWKPLPDTHLFPAFQSGMQTRGFPGSAGATGIVGHDYPKLPPDDTEPVFLSLLFLPPLCP